MTSLYIPRIRGFDYALHMAEDPISPLGQTATNRDAARCEAPSASAESLPGSAAGEPAPSREALTVESSLAGVEASNFIANDALAREVQSHFNKCVAEASSHAPDTALTQHCCSALKTFDAVSTMLTAETQDVSYVLSAAREELLDSYFAAATGRLRVALAVLRGVTEGLFMALYYRRQEMSLHLWAASKGFVMVHQLLDGEHEFRKYYKSLFEDDGFTQQYPGVSEKMVFKEAVEVYDVLSGYVHKKRRQDGRQALAEYQSAVERMFRIFLCFLEREEDLPALEFPNPVTFAVQKSQPVSKRKQ